MRTASGKAVPFQFQLFRGFSQVHSLSWDNSEERKYNRNPLLTASIHASVAYTAGNDVNDFRISSLKKPEKYSWILWVRRNSSDAYDAEHLYSPRPTSRLFLKSRIVKGFKICNNITLIRERRAHGGGMRLLRTGCVLTVLLVCFISVNAETQDNKFTKKEILKMAETKAIIETKFGNIELKFFPDVAPNHVNNFIELAKKGFYDGTTFHRVIPGFMIQGGDPNSKSPDRSQHGMGGPGYSIKAEFNAKPHKRGTLSMARSANPDSGGSQFFICVVDAFSLDRQYTVFGEVVSGMDVVDKIVSQPRDRMDNPTERIEMKVRIVEK